MVVRLRGDVKEDAMTAGEGSAITLTSIKPRAMIIMSICS
jgi:hypothetical protein